LKPSWRSFVPANMGFGTPEKVCRKHHKRPYTYETWLKRATARFLRRQARRDPENAPRKPHYRGWSD
jgi:hypothetical protein